MDGWRSTRHLVVLLILLSAAAAAQSGGGGWERVRSLAPQSRLDILTERGKSHCRFVSATEELITCEQGSFRRAEVRQVRTVRRGRSTAKGTLIGLAVGTGTGVALGAALGNSAFKTPGRGAAVGIAIFAPLGAAVGALTGVASGSSETLYSR